MKFKIKKIISVLLVMIMFCGIAPLSTVADIDISSVFSVKAANTLSPSGQCGDNVYWTFDESTGLLTISGTGDMYDFDWDGSPFYDTLSIIKSVVIGNSVTNISDYTFASCFGLTSVTIGNSVTSIGYSAFKDCYDLTSVIIGNSVTSIGDYAFDYCSSLTSITIPDGVTSISNHSFANCSFTSITIPDSVTSIGEWAFWGCDALTSITIPDSVTSIGNYVFESCDGLTSITIPDSVTSIGKWAFSHCEALTSITVDKDNKVYDSRNNCNAIIETETNTLICGCKNTIIPDSVTSIGDVAFGGCSGLTSITIPDSVTSIGEGAFAYCYSLTSITIPDSVTSIGNYAFDWCSGLTSVTIPDSVTSIGNSAFRSCDKLKDVYYSGTEQQWNKITIEDYNDPLLNANIHFMGADVPAQSNVFEVKYKETAKFKPQIAMVDNEAYTVTYTSSDTSVATVDKDGNITTHHKGEAKITCTVTDEYGNTQKDSCTVNVKFQWWQWLIWIFLLGFLWY